MPSNVFFLILSVLIFVMVFAQVRNQKMKEKYAALWLLVSAAIIVLALFPHLLSALADLTGVIVPVNLLFMLAIIMLIGICLHLTLDLSRLGEDTRTLAEEVAMLRAQLEQGSADNLRRPVPAESRSEEEGK
ncbi:MAG: DUF2304 domain-containing protein [Rothia sp. (in: high G+C Gram-positive bacteria)]|uniref:DUF2304 domain-containing protein n=1 Tax=Rothia sp. (in: high G+C Gram-positive bacteria) TaxID=1885016 RepID=UPI00270E9A8A|nr:DUF2304 domain-containing protein [Rothia sp. (in: high G+C Gram-positive bacteria)]